MNTNQNGALKGKWYLVECNIPEEEQFLFVYFCCKSRSF